MALETIKNQIEKYVKELNDEFVYELYQRLPFGKMLRSKLFEVISQESDKSSKLCAIIEMIHLSSMM